MHTWLLLLLPHILTTSDCVTRRCIALWLDVPISPAPLSNAMLVWTFCSAFWDTSIALRIMGTWGSIPFPPLFHPIIFVPFKKIPIVLHATFLCLSCRQKQHGSCTAQWNFLVSFRNTALTSSEFVELQQLPLQLWCCHEDTTIEVEEWKM